MITPQRIIMTGMCYYIEKHSGRVLGYYFIEGVKILHHQVLILTKFDIPRVIFLNFFKTMQIIRLLTV